MEVDWHEFSHALGKRIDLEFLSLNKLEFHFLFNAVSNLLPLVLTTDRIQIGEMQLYLQKEIGVQILGLHIDLSPKEHDVINLNLFLTIANQKGFRPKCTLIIKDTMS